MSLIRLACVEGPVRMDSAMERKRPACEDRCAAFEPPPSAGEPHAVFAQGATRAFADARSDRIPLGQGGGRVERRGVLGQSGGAWIDGRAWWRTQTLQGRATAEGSPDGMPRTVPPLRDRVRDPLRGVGVLRVARGLCGLPALGQPVHALE